MIRFLADWLLPILVVISTVSLLVFVPNKYKYRDYSYVIMAALTSLLVGKLLSVVYQPDVARPFLEKGVKAGAIYINNPGFPSDHVLLLSVLALAVAVLVKRPALTAALFIGVGLVAIGRVLALVHTPLDVVGGVACGLVGGLWYIKMTQEKLVR